jgi:hypothetical protein
MPKKLGTPRLLVLKNKQAPSRGNWVIYPSLPEIGFTACHEIEHGKQGPKATEEIFLKTIIDVRTFYSNLIQHGWTANLNGTK